MTYGPDQRRFDLMARLRDVEDDIRFLSPGSWIADKLKKVREETDSLIKELIYEEVK